MIENKEEKPIIMEEIWKDGLKSLQINTIKAFVNNYEKLNYGECPYINKDSDCENTYCLTCFTSNYLKEYYGE